LFIFKKNWFLNIVILLLLYGFVYNLIAVFFPESFVPEDITVRYNQTEEEAVKSAINRIKQGAAMGSIILGLLFFITAFYKVLSYSKIFSIGYRASPYKEAYRQWIVDKIEGNFTFHKKPIDFEIFNKSRLCQGIKLELVRFHELHKVHLYDSLGSYRGAWERNNLQIGNVFQTFASKEESWDGAGGRRNTIAFDALFIAIDLPNTLEGELIVRKYKGEKKGSRRFKMSIDHWGKLVPIGDSQFDKNFSVHGSKLVADNWLNSNVRKALLEAQLEIDKDISISIGNGVFSIAMPNMINLLDPTLGKNLDEKHIENQLASIKKFVTKLNLN